MKNGKPQNLNPVHNKTGTPASDYEIGYRKPPVRSQFPKGRSGNPTGRSRGKGGAGKSLKEILFETVPVRRGDRTIRASRYEVVMRRFVNEALKGDWRLGLKILELVPYAELRERSQQSQRTKPITPEEAAEAYRRLMEAGRGK